MTSENVVELHEKDFDKITSKGNWVVDFWASWCGPCKMMAPHFAEAAKELKGKVNFAKVNVEEEQELANRFQVMSIPTILFLKGGEQVNRAVGAMPKESLLELSRDSF